jgi:hypothetical protein
MTPTDGAISSVFRERIACRPARWEFPKKITEHGTAYDLSQANETFTGSTFHQKGNPF